MKNISIYIIIDNLFKFILTFILNLIWCSYFIENFTVAIIIAILLSLIILLVINMVSFKRNKKSKNILKEEQKILDIKNTFLFMTNVELIEFFNNLVLTKHKSIKFDNYIKVISSGLPIILYPMFKYNSLTENDFISIYKNFKNQKIKKLIILTNLVDNNTNKMNFDLNFEVLILDYKQVYYNLLKEYEFYPEIIIKNKKKIKNNFKQLLSFALNKRKTKGYFISAIFILFASFFVRYKIYYLIFSSFLIFLALFSWLNPNFNKVDTKKIFE